MQMDLARQVSPLIDSLAVKLQVPAKFIYEAYVRQVKVDFWLASAFALVPITLWTLCAVCVVTDKRKSVERAKRTARSYGDESKYDQYIGYSGGDGWSVGLGICAAISTAVWMFIFFLTFSHYLNPQYAAISSILSDFRGK